MVTDKIQEGKKEDVPYQAFAETLQKRNLRPASETYLELARRHALYGGKRRPYWELGRDFAIAHMDHVRKDDTWEVDWDGERERERELPNVWQTGIWTIPTLSCSRDSSITP